MYDFLIIGGGIAGISAAARLSALGSVCVVETEDALAYHASGRSAAIFFLDYGNDIVRSLNAATQDYLAMCCGGDGVLSPRGIITLANDAQADQMAESLASTGATAISVADAQSMVPIIDANHVTSASFMTDGQDIDTDRLIQDFAKSVRSNGGTILTGSKVIALTKDMQGWIVSLVTSRKAGPQAPTTLKARNVVNAAGAWVDQIAKLAGIAPLGFTPFRRSIARTPAPGGHDVSGWPFMIDVEERWFAKPDAGKYLISPAEADPAEPFDAYADDMVLAEGIARYEPYVSEPVTRVETSWAGLRTFAADRSLVLGPDPNDPTFIWCAGQGGYGFQTSAAASAVLAQSVGGPDSGLGPDIIAALSPNRF